MVVEVELRSFISPEKYQELIAFFQRHGTFINQDYQETYYFNAKEDLRIQKNNFFSKIWMKKGKIHDEAREEIEIKFPKEDFEKLEKLFLSLGYEVQIKWFRTRHAFKWNNVEVAIDFTKGYGHIIELELLTEDAQKEKALEELRSKFNSLNIQITAKEEFDKKYQFYKENWKTLTTS